MSSSVSSGDIHGEESQDTSSELPVTQRSSVTCSAACFASLGKDEYHSMAEHLTVGVVSSPEPPHERECAVCDTVVLYNHLST